MRAICGLFFVVALCSIAGCGRGEPATPEDEAYRALVRRAFNTGFPGNAFKWAAVERRRGERRKS